MIVEGRNYGDWENYPLQIDAPFLKRTTSALGPAAYQRVEEWNKNSWSGFDLAAEAASKKTRRISQNRWRDGKQFPSKSSQSMPLNPDFLENDDVTPWDSISVTSSRNKIPLSQKDSGALDMYFEDNNQRMQKKRYNSHHTLKPNRLSSISSLRKSGRSVSTQDDGSNSKLLSCIDSLEYLSKKLENVTKVSSEIDKFRMASESFSLRKSNGSMPSQEEQEESEGFDWRVGDDYLCRRNKEGKHRRRSYDSASTDSGINSNNDSGQGQFDRPLSHFDSRNLNPLQRLTSYNSTVSNNKGYSHQKLNHELRANDSMSSGYSSENSSLQNPLLSGIYASQQDPTMYSGGNMANPTVQSQNTWYDYEGVCGSEDPYGYGTFGYASSSVYDEELHQNNGWFYLPNHEPNVSQSIYQTPSPQEHFNNTVQQNVYPNLEHSYPSYQAFTGTENSSYSYPNQMWPGSNYGSLSGTFLNPMEGMSALGAAISATCAKDHSSITSPQEVNANGLDSTWAPEKGLHTGKSDQGDGKKRKSVRFSQTVRQRIEKNELEVEDTTSTIKGDDGDEPAEKAQDHPAITESTNQSHYDSVKTMSGNEQPIYSFPTGHIASSCMCSDCCLTRSVLGNSSSANPSLSCY